MLLESSQGVDYKKLSNVLNSMDVLSKVDHKGLKKGTVKNLLNLAQSDRERECIRYAIFKASRMTPTRVRHRYGFEGMAKRAKKVEDVIDEVLSIREAINDLATIEDTAVLATLGIQSVSDSDDESDIQLDSSFNSADSATSEVFCLSLFKELIHQSCYNWFDVVDQAELQLGLTKQGTIYQLEEVLKQPHNIGLNEHQVLLLK